MTLPVPSVTITVQDQGSNTVVTLPQSNVQVVLGCATGGMTNVPVATRNPNVLTSFFSGGPLVEYGALACNAGIAIAVGLPIVTIGTATAVIFTGTGNSAITVTLDSTNGAWDDYYCWFKCTTGGTIGTPGIQFQFSLDAGRNFGPIINLLSATSYAIPNTGLTLHFGTGTLSTGDFAKFSTAGPKWNDAGVQAALQMLAGSQLAVAGWGSMHLVGTASAGDAVNVETYMDAMATQFVFDRIALASRDASPSSSWGGTGETEVTWTNSLESTFGAVTARRVVVAAGYYNTPSVLPNVVAGTPSYRRSLAWDDALRRMQVAPQTRGGQVNLGALASIVVDPNNDPLDGFIYHDERVNPGLTGARFMAAMTWPKFPGFFVAQEPLFSPVGSTITELVLGNVVDIASDIVYEEGALTVSANYKVLSTGALTPQSIAAISGDIQSGLTSQMTNVGQVSSVTLYIDPNANVLSLGYIQVQVTILPLFYVNAIVFTINLATP